MPKQNIVRCLSSPLVSKIKSELAEKLHTLEASHDAVHTRVSWHLIRPMRSFVASANLPPWVHRDYADQGPPFLRVVLSTKRCSRRLLTTWHVADQSSRAKRGVVVGISLRTAYVHPWFRRQGLMTTILKLLTTFVKQSPRLNFVQINRVVSPDMQRLVEQQAESFQLVPSAHESTYCWVCQ